MAQSAIIPTGPALEGEIWLRVPDFSLYQVSNRGRVWSSFSTGHFLKLIPYGPPGYEYPGVTLSNGPTRWRIKVHQLVMLVFVGPPPEGQEVRHLDGDRYRNHWPENLEYATHIANQSDMLKHGTAALAKKLGSQRLNSKLTEELVPVIRAEYAAGGVTERVLAVRYGVDVSAMHRMLARQTWKHVA